MAAWTLKEAENSAKEVFGRAFTGEPQILMRNGIPSLVVITYADFETTRDAPASLSKPSQKPEEKMSFVDFLRSCPCDISDLIGERDTDTGTNRDPVFAEDVFK